MNLEKLNILKQKLQQAGDFNEVWVYFFDELGCQPGFMNHGDVLEDESLSSIIQAVGEKLLKYSSEMEVMLKSIPEYNFVHGGFLQGNKMVSVIYFDDIDMGLMAAMSMMSMKTELARFSKLAASQNSTIVENPSNTLH